MTSHSWNDLHVEVGTFCHNTYFRLRLNLQLYLLPEQCSAQNRTLTAWDIFFGCGTIILLDKIVLNGNDCWVVNTAEFHWCFKMFTVFKLPLLTLFPLYPFFFFPLPIHGLFVLYIADNADSVWAGQPLPRTRRLCGAQGSYLSAWPPTSLLQEPKFMAMQKVDITRWMSLTTVFQLECSPQDKKPREALCSNRNLAWGNCSYCLSLRQLWAMKLDECVWRSLLVDGWTAEHKTKDRVRAVLAVFSPEGHLGCCSNTLPCRYISALPHHLGHHQVSGPLFSKDKKKHTQDPPVMLQLGEKCSNCSESQNDQLWYFSLLPSSEIMGLVWNGSADGSHCRLTKCDWNKA